MKKYFLTGLLILLPLVLTIAIVIFMVDFLTQPFIGVVTPLVKKFIPLNHSILFLHPDEIIRYGSKVLILISLFVTTIFLGMVARWFFVKYLISIGDKILHKIPLVNKVYKTSQEIIKTLLVTDKDSFKQVVLVPFGNDSCYVLGLVSRDSPSSCKQACQKNLVSVLMPTAPNPTTGYLFLHEKEKLIYVDMKTEEAIKFIVSCGVVTPEHPEIHEE